MEVRRARGTRRALLRRIHAHAHALLPDPFPPQPPPRPLPLSWLPLLGSAIAFGKDPLAFLRLQQQRHGDIFTAVVGGQRMVFVCDHATWGAIFRMRETLSFKPIGYKVVSTAFQVPMSTITPVFGSDAGHLLHKQLVTHMAGDKLQGLAASAGAALERALRRMEERASGPDAEGFQVANMYSAVARALFDTTLETFHGDGFASDKSWLDFTAYDAQFSYLAGGAPAVLFPGALQALGHMCALFEGSPSYATPDAPASLLMRERRRVFTELQQQACLCNVCVCVCVCV